MAVPVAAVCCLGLGLGGGGCSSGNGSCGKVEPCGGDVVGTWKASGSCVNTAALNASVGSDFMSQCPGASVGNPRQSISGTITFNGNLTYTRNITTSASMDMTIPASCLTQGGITLTCAQLNAAFQQAFQGDPNSDIASFTCGGSGSCSCRFTLKPTTTSDSGTYSTSGTTMALTATSGGIDGGDYCVQDKTLHLVSVDRTTNMGPMGQATIEADVTYSKQ